MSKPQEEHSKTGNPPPVEGQQASNVGNPSRAAQVAAGDKATAPDLLPRKPKGEPPPKK